MFYFCPKCCFATLLLDRGGGGRIIGGGDGYQSPKDDKPQDFNLTVWSEDRELGWSILRYILSG